MKTFVLCCLLSAFTLGAAQNYQPHRRGAFQVTSSSPAPAWCPTNLDGGAYVAGYWVANNAITNGSGQVTNLPDLWKNGWDLKFRAASTIPYISNNWVNGHAIIHFNGAGDCLTNPAVTVAQNLETWMLMMSDTADQAAGNQFVWESISGTPVAFFWCGVCQSRWDMYSGSDATFPFISVPNKKWIIQQISFAGANSSWATNGVFVSAGFNPGSASMSGFILGARNSYAESWKGDMAEMILFSATNSSANRTMIISNWNQKYNMGLP